MGSLNTENELELLRAQVRHLQGQNNVMAMTTTALTQQLAETSAAVSLDQQKHNRIISNPVFVSALLCRARTLTLTPCGGWYSGTMSTSRGSNGMVPPGARERTTNIRDGRRTPGRSRWQVLLRACALRLVVMTPSISPRMIRHSVELVL